jgi:hypothetical protein
MYKIELLPEYDDEDINIESEIIFENGTKLYFSDRPYIILRDRSFTINKDRKGIECITYLYESEP